MLDAGRLLLVMMSLVLGLDSRQIVFPEAEPEDGDPCTLTTGDVGQCQEYGKCGIRYSDLATSCGFSNFEPIICCDVVRRQCEGIPSDRATSRMFIHHVMGNAETVEVGEFPFMALITYKTGGSETDDEVHLRCGAFLVSKRFLLTAAHCILNDAKLERYSVKLGTNSVNDTLADSYLIKKVYKHEKYKGRQNDIGIVELTEDVALNSNVLPICVYAKQEDLSETTDLTVMGWGVANDEELSGVLLKGTVQPVPRTACRARLNVGLTNRIKLKDTHMCALGGKNENGTATDTCQGDSGGPMVLKEGNKNYVVAMVSTGSGCGSDYFPGIYTRVNKFLPWLIQQGVFRNL